MITPENLHKQLTVGEVAARQWHPLLAGRGLLGGLDRQETIPDSRAQQFIADATRQALARPSPR